MKKISYDEYRERLDSFIKNEYGLLKEKPSGMFGHMSFYINAEKSFQRILEEQKITVDFSTLRKNYE